MESGALPGMDEFRMIERIKSYFDRIRERNGELNAFLAVFDEERVLREAEAARGPLAGMAVAVKDNIAVRGEPLTCASRILEGHTAPYDATVVRRLKEAGAVLLGKTNLDEFAMGSSTEYSAFGPTMNPADLERVPGGSSGGSAAAVAAGLCDAALGSDTGGSVRQPAAFCGVVGFKPTYGRVSRYGLVAFGSSLDQVGVFARDVGTVARVAQVISGGDEADSTTAPHPVEEYPAALERGVEGLTIGLPREYLPEELEAPVLAAVRAAASALERAGAKKVVEVSLPHTDAVIPCYYVIATAEASSNLARFDGGRYGLRVEADTLLETYIRSRSQGFGPEVKRRIMLGTFVLSAGYYEAYYGRAMRVRRLIRDDFTRVFEDGVDLLLTPTAPTPAFRFGEKADPLAMYLSDIFTVAVNLAGVPAISVPGMTDGLPIGVQLIAPHFGEEVLFRAARVIERGGSE